MAPYIGYLLLAGLQILLFCKDGKIKRQYVNVKKYLTLCCIELVVLAGFRGYTVGADTPTYLGAIDYYGTLSVSELIGADLVYPFDFEIGYFLLTKLSVFLGLGKTGFLFVVALIIYIPIFLTIKKYSKMPYISILSYFAFGLFGYSLGLFRQMMAISILLLGWEYIVERRLIKYLLLVFFAMTFHTTAAIGMFIYVLYGVKWDRFLFCLIPLEIILLLFGRQIVVLAIYIFPKYAGFLGGKYDVQGGSYLMLILLNLIFFTSIVFQGKNKDICEDMTYCGIMLAICLQCLGYSMGIFGRIVSYYSIYLILAVPNLVRNVGNKLGPRWRLVIVLGVSICLGILIFRSFSGDKYGVPYYTVFSDL